jgi:hypothetical protein
MLKLFLFCSVGDPDPQIRMCLGIQDPDPDPLVRGADPDPALDHSLF